MRIDKKIIVLLSIAILMLVLVSGCSRNQDRLPKAEAVIEGKIVNLNENSFLLASDKSGLMSVTANYPIYDQEGNKSDTSALKNGQLVEIGFSGMIMESYPGQLGDPKYIRIVEQGDDLAGLYGAIIKELLYEEDKDNKFDDYAVIDLSQISNVSVVEKEAIINFSPTSAGFIGISGTYDDFAKSGYAENGVFVGFEMIESTETTMKFDIYRMNDKEERYYLRGVIAEKIDGEWQYNVTSQGE